MPAAPGRNQATQRVFFALWPDAHLQKALYDIGERIQGAFGGRVVAAQNIHLTLAFVGSVSAGRVDELLDIGASIKAAPFALNLIETGCWKRSAVGWIAPDATPRPLQDLVLELRQRLMESRFHVDDKPFAPHLTLLRKAKCNGKSSQPVQTDQAAQSNTQLPLAWSIDQFVLMRSDTLPSGPEYTRLAVWRLC